MHNIFHCVRSLEEQTACDVYLHVCVTGLPDILRG